MPTLQLSDDKNVTLLVMLGIGTQVAQMESES